MPSCKEAARRLVFHETYTARIRGGAINATAGGARMRRAGWQATAKALRGTLIRGSCAFVRAFTRCWSRGICLSGRNTTEEPSRDLPSPWLTSPESFEHGFFSCAHQPFQRRCKRVGTPHSDRPCAVPVEAVQEAGDVNATDTAPLQRGVIWNTCRGMVRLDRQSEHCCNELSSCTRSVGIRKRPTTTPASVDLTPNTSPRLLQQEKGNRSRSPTERHALVSFV